MKKAKINPAAIIESEIIRHITPDKQAITIRKSKKRLLDIALVKKTFPSIKNVLCIGCRHDSEVEDFIKSGLDAVGIDIAIGTDKIIKLDAHELSGKFNHFDLIYCSHSLEHMYNAKLVMKNIRELTPVAVFIVLPLENFARGPTIKHPTVFDIMMISDVNSKISTIRKEVERSFNNGSLEDFNALGKFKISSWVVRYGELSNEKEIAFLLEMIHD